MVEQEAVNFEVVGSSPTPGARPSITEVDRFPMTGFSIYVNTPLIC
jgi:hypothetical protein